MPVTVVTCFYRLDKSKHTLREYDAWINNLLWNVKCKLIIFTNRETSANLQDKLRQASGLDYQLITRELNELYVTRKYPDIWEEQEALDPDRESGRGQD